MSSVRTGNVAAETVHQQTTNYLSGLSQMLALAAKARGSSVAKADSILQEMRIADIASKTVFQQEVTALVGVMKLLSALATGN